MKENKPQFNLPNCIVSSKKNKIAFSCSALIFAVVFQDLHRKGEKNAIKLSTGLFGSLCKIICYVYVCNAKGIISVCMIRLYLIEEENIRINQRKLHEIDVLLLFSFMLHFSLFSRMRWRSNANWKEISSIENGQSLLQWVENTATLSILWYWKLFSAFWTLASAPCLERTCSNNFHMNWCSSRNFIVRSYHF